MAAPITHIILALVILKSGLLPNFNEKEFIIGTSFPDIRYLGVIDRKATHAKNVTLAMIAQEKDAFKAGMLFHALVDRVREDFMVKHNVYAMVPKSKYSSQLLKFNEDHILYPLITEWEWKKLGNYFDTILQQEQAFGIATSSLKQWHSFLKNYCSSRPTSTNAHQFAQILTPIPLELLGPGLQLEIAHQVQKFTLHTQLKKVVVKFYKDFLSLV